MPQLGLDAPFVDEAGAKVIVPGEVRVEHLERVEAVQAQVPHLVDGRHPPLPQQAEDFVAALELHSLFEHPGDSCARKGLAYSPGSRKTPVLSDVGKADTTFKIPWRRLAGRRQAHEGGDALDEHGRARLLKGFVEAQPIDLINGVSAAVMDRGR